MSSLKKPYIGIIANSTSPKNRDDLIKELGEPKNGFFAPLKFSYNEIEGGIVPLDIQPQDVLTTSGIRKAKLALEAAIDYLVSLNAKVICLAASTKRLAGRSGRSLKKKYPKVTFTIGDNATAISFKNLIMESLSLLNFDKKKDIAFILGSGFLGTEATEFLQKIKCKNLIVLSEFYQPNFRDLTLIKSLKEVDKKIKLMLSCTHKHNLGPGSLNFLEKEAVIIDVAVPPGVGIDLYQSLNSGISRFDGGDFFLRKINYDFCPGIMSIPAKEIWYGCFVEAIMLTLAGMENDLSLFNFFEINQENEDLLLKYLRREKVLIPIVNFFAKDKNDFALLSL